MDETIAYTTNRGGRTIPALLVALGLIVGGWLLGAEIKETRLGDRYVAVKGLAERNVKSDLAIWPLGYKEAGDDLTALYAKSEGDKKGILQFLDKQGIQTNEIELGVVQVIDTQANEYGGARAPRRYIVQQQITARTTRVDQIAAASQKTMELLQQGIVLNNNQGQGLIFKFTGLNSIKPDMITEATRNARASADRFASDSGSKVGAIRQANQGVFSILASNSGSTNEDQPGVEVFSSDSSLMKTVRVVSSVQYYLEK